MKEKIGHYRNVKKDLLRFIEKENNPDEAIGVFAATIGIPLSICYYLYGEEIGMEKVQDKIDGYLKFYNQDGIEE